MIYRIDDRAELVPPFNEDASVDPETQELWMLVRDRDKRHPSVGHFVISGDELRALVGQATALRSTLDR